MARYLERIAAGLGRDLGGRGLRHGRLLPRHLPRPRRRQRRSATVVEDVVKITGRIDLVHCNDSRDEFDSGADRHANFGQGQIDPERPRRGRPRRRRPGGVRDARRRRGAPGRLRLPARARVRVGPPAAGPCSAAAAPACSPAAARPRRSRRGRHPEGRCGTTTATGRQQFGDLYLPAAGPARHRGGDPRRLLAEHVRPRPRAPRPAPTSPARLGGVEHRVPPARGRRRLADHLHRRRRGGRPLRRLDGVDLGSLVTLGHSAGGQLAAWAASRAASRCPAGPAGRGSTGVVSAGRRARPGPGGPLRARRQRRPRPRRRDARPGAGALPAGRPGRAAAARGAGPLRARHRRRHRAALAEPGVRRRGPRRRRRRPAGHRSPATTSR